MTSRKQTFEVLNVKCGGCALMLKKKLFDEFGEVEVDLGKEPRRISLNIAEQQVPSLKKTLKKLGYPMVSEKMGFVESMTTEAKSFISCALGKMNS